MRSITTRPDDDGVAIGGLGHRNKVNLESMFPGSPLVDPTYAADPVRNIYGAALLQGNAELTVGSTTYVTPTGDIQGTAGYYGFSSDVNLNFGENDPPNYDAVPTAAEFPGLGNPASAYVPNLTSPGPGSLDARDQAPFAGTLPDAFTAATKQFGRGGGTTISPNNSSTAIATQTLATSLGRDYSYATSDEVVT